MVHKDILKSNNSVDSALETFICNICLKSSFPSRNKLYKHIKICQVNNNIIKQNEAIDEQDYKDCYLYVVGGRIRGKTLHTVERFSFHKEQWEDCIPMLENRGSHGAASLNNILYVVGGGGMNSNLSSCEAYNGINWYEIAPLQVSRHALAVISAGNNSIYAVGGWVDGKECSNMIERYVLSLNQWKSVGALLLARRLHGVASFKSCPSIPLINNNINNNPMDNNNNDDYRLYKIYIFGGHCNDPHWQTNAAEVYDPISNTCTTIQPMPVAGGTSAIAISSYIYVFVHGKYVLRYNPSLDEYIRLSDLPLKEWHCFDVSLIQHNQQQQQYKYIYVYGGITNGKWLKPLYRYCILTDTWKEMPSMKSARRRCASAIVYHTVTAVPQKDTIIVNNSYNNNIQEEESSKKPKS